MFWVTVQSPCYALVKNAEIFFILWIKDIGHRRHVDRLCVRIFFGRVST